MFGRFTSTKRIAEAEAAAAAHAAAPFAAPEFSAEPPIDAPSLQAVAELPKIETTEAAPSITPLRDKLLDAKVRLHRRLIEEINLSAIEKVSEGEVRRQISALVAHT
jgi:pilus assembly protein CpaF